MSDQRILEKLDDLIEKVSDIDKTLAVNTELLEIHMKRSQALEDLVEAHRRHTDAQLEEALLPIKTARGIYTIAKWMAAIGSALTAAGSILYALLKLHH